MEWFVAWLAILALGISFIGSGTGSKPEHFKWARRFGVVGISLAIVAAVIAVV